MSVIEFHKKSKQKKLRGKSIDIECVGCGELTAWQDGICHICTIEVPDYISYRQIRDFYLLKRKKDEIHK
jgi:hypothetical protein